MKKVKKSKSKRGKSIKVNKKMTFAEVLEKKPKAVEIFMKNGMFCFGCSMASYETIEEGSKAHGIDPDKIIKQIEKL